LSDWRFHLMTLPDGEWVDRDLPLQEAKVIEALSAPASISGRLPLGYRMINTPSGKRALVEWGAAIIAEQDGRNPVFGIVDGLSSDGDWLKVESGGFSSYPAGMPWMSESYSSTHVDALDVVRLIWSKLQGKAGGDLGVVVDSTQSGYILGKPEGGELTAAKSVLATKKITMNKAKDQVEADAYAVKYFADSVFTAAGLQPGGSIIRQMSAPSGDKRSKRNIWLKGDSTGLSEGYTWDGKKWVELSAARFNEVSEFYGSWVEQKPRLAAAKSDLSMAKESYNDAKSRVSELSDQEADPFTLTWWEDHDLGQIISDLATQAPFDYREQTEWDGDDRLSLKLRIGSPEIGTHRENLRLEIGVNVTAPPPLAESEYVSEVLVIGAGEGRSTVKATATGNPGRLRRVAVIERKDFTKEPQATVQARKELEARNAEWTFDSLSLVDHDMCPYGSFEAGDWIYMSGDAGWMYIDQWVRVLEIEVDCTTGQLNLKVSSK